MSSFTVSRKNISGLATSGNTIASVAEQENFTPNLPEFLNEQDPVKAIRYFLAEFNHNILIKTSDDIVNCIYKSIANIDQLINKQVNEIIHHPTFQKLESSWRGVKFLCEQKKQSSNVKIRILDISWPELSKDINHALEFDQSQIFQKVYSDEYGIAGGEPFGVLLGDYEISHKISDTHRNDDILTLAGMSEIAAASFSPFITGVSNELFGLNNFSELGLPLNLQTIFKQNEYIRWNQLREKLDTRFIGLTVPRMLARIPYNTKNGYAKNLYFKEITSKSDNSDSLWMNACYGFGSVLIREFTNVGWFGHIRGVLRDKISGGLVETTTIDFFQADKNNIWHKPITDVVITDKLERELSDLGFIPLCQCYDNPNVAFYNNQSIHKPNNSKDELKNSNAKLSVMLQHILCGSRIAHYIKIIFRDKIGSSQSTQSIEQYMQKWLHKYTTGRDDLEWEEQARYPLREAHVKVKEHPIKPGQYICIITIKPHYQLDQMVSELELATELLEIG